MAYFIDLMRFRTFWPKAIVRYQGTWKSVRNTMGMALNRILASMYVIEIQLYTLIFRLKSLE